MRSIVLILACVMLLQIQNLMLFATAQAPNTITCEDALPSRLAPDMIGRVTPGDPNRVRNTPSTSGELIGQIPGEGQFYVLNGPVCADGFAWWFVEHEGLVGWTPEGGSSYWLEVVSDEFMEAPSVMDAEVISDFAFNGLTLSLSSFITNGAVGEIVPEVLPEDGMVMLDTAPEHTRITFEGANYPYLAVYPAHDYETFKETSLDPLRELLAQRPENPSFVNGPIVNAGQVFAVQTAYVDFTEGSGVRAIVHWAQNPNLLTDGGIYYIYAGLTSDENYLVHLVIPVDADRLPQYLTVIGENWDYQAFEKVYADYRQVAAQMIADLPADSFSPSLDRLDALVASLDLTAINREVMENAEGAPCVASRSRLIVGEFARQALAQDSLRVREAPNGAATNNNVFPGQLLRVISGPVCANDILWWEIAAEEGWTGWVAESGSENYFFAVATRTPTPTLTFTPSATFTPTVSSTPRPTATQIVTNCIITPLADTNLRVEPDVNSRRFSVVYRGERYYAQAIYQRKGEPFPWLQIGSRVDATTNNVSRSWLRADFVTEEGDCSTLPVYELP